MARIGNHMHWNYGSRVISNEFIPASINPNNNWSESIGESLLPDDSYGCGHIWLCSQHNADVSQPSLLRSKIDEMFYRLLHRAPGDVLISAVTLIGVITNPTDHGRWASYISSRLQNISWYHILYSHGSNTFDSFRPRRNRRQFHMHILEWKCIDFSYNLTEVYSQRCNYQYSSIGSDDDLAPTREQTIIWNNNDYFTDAYMRHPASISYIFGIGEWLIPSLEKWRWNISSLCFQIISSN